MSGKRSMTAPEFRTLTASEMVEVLAKNHVGRIAYSLRDRVDIQPLHYVFSHGWIYGRTSPGSKLTTIRQNYWVAFEVDEVTSLFEWRSVVVHGGFYVLSAEGAEHEQAAWHHGLQLLRGLVPQTLLPDDPVPHRTVLFRIAVQQATGREARPGRAGMTAR